MKIRFRYLDSDGGEVEIAGLTELGEHMRSGRISDFTLLYDALTGEWAPARTHTVYRLLSERDVEVEPGGDPGEQEADPFDMVLTLDDTEPTESREETLERLRRERAGDDDEVGGRRSDVASMSSPGVWSPGRAEPGEAPPPPDAEPPSPPPPSEPSADPAPPEPAIGSRRAPPDAPDVEKSARPVRSVPRAEDALDSGPFPEPRPSRWSIRHRRRWWSVGGVLVLGAIVLVPLYLIALPTGSDRGDAAFDRGARPVGTAALSGAGPSAPVVVRLAAPEREGVEEMVEGMDSLRASYDVEAVPEAWLEGEYIGQASAHPEIEEFWERFQDFTDALRARDTALFRKGLVRRLRARDVPDPMVSIRLASAVEGFEARQPGRDTVYRRMDGLARRALELHQLLVEREDDLEHDPTTTTRAARNPILQAWSEDPRLTDSIWALLDDILGELAFLQGDRDTSRDQVMDRILERIRAVSSTAVVRSATRRPGPGED